MPKLTLSVNANVVEKAKLYAKRNQTSVSAMVEQYLNAVVSGGATQAPTPGPVLQEMRGLLKTGSREQYRQHLSRKHR